MIGINLVSQLGTKSVLTDAWSFAKVQRWMLAAERGLSLVN